MKDNTAWMDTVDMLREFLVSNHTEGELEKLVRSLDIPLDGRPRSTRPRTRKEDLATKVLTGVLVGPRFGKNREEIEVCFKAMDFKRTGKTLVFKTLPGNKAAERVKEIESLMEDGRRWRKFKEMLKE